MNTIPFGPKQEARWLIYNLREMGGCTQKEYEEAIAHLDKCEETTH